MNSNRGKHGVVLDLKQPAAQAELHELLATADMVVCNWRQPVADKLGLRDEELAARYPRLIRVWVSGFGPTGPLASSPVFDTIIQARLGLTEAEVELHLETKGPAHCAEVGQALREAGYTVMD